LKLKGIIISIIITFLLCGLWHGAKWTFVAWGLLNGIYLAVHYLWMQSNFSNTFERFFKFPRWIKNFVFTFLFFHLISFTWIFFRSQDFNIAWEYIVGIFSFRGAYDVPGIAILLSLLLVPLELTQNFKVNVLKIRTFPRLAKATYYLLMILSIILLSGNEVPFIYFQF
jgi:D-alanyl-lipoteichoic acid acyltransferase DltB (MBOAT superfamily)